MHACILKNQGYIMLLCRCSLAAAHQLVNAAQQGRAAAKLLMHAEVSSTHNMARLARPSAAAPVSLPSHGLLVSWRLLSTRSWHTQCARLSLLPSLCCVAPAGIHRVVTKPSRHADRGQLTPTSRGLVMRFSTASTTPSLVRTPIAVDPSCTGRSRRSGEPANHPTQPHRWRRTP